MKLKISKKIRPELKKAQYHGPLTVADINLSSWDTFFREGGTLNAPNWMQTNRLNEIKKKYTLLAKLHGA